MNEAVLDQSARVTRVAAPIASPGHCRICGKPQHDLGFAATEGWDEEFYGTVYLCADCVGDYARVFGYMSSDQVEGLLSEVKRQSDEISLLRESVANLENILDAYSRLRPNGGVPDHRSDHSNITSEVIADDNDKGTKESVTAGEGADSPTAKHANEQGRDDVLGSTSTDEFLADLGLDL